MLNNVIRYINLGSKRKFSNLSFLRAKAAYDGEGKTTVRILNRDIDLGIMIDSFATYGFKLNNGVTVLGPMAIFPRSIMSWQVTEAEKITEESLRLFKILDPKIDLLVLGVDTNKRSTINQVFKVARGCGLNVEILPTEHACSTFNFLNAEGRSIAAALIPPYTIQMSDDDIVASNLHYGDVFNKDLMAKSRK